MLRRATKKTGIPSLYRIAFEPVSASRFYSSSSDYSSSSSSVQSGSDGQEGYQRQPRRERDHSTILHLKLPAGSTREKLTEVLNQAGITGIVNVNIPRDLYTEAPKSYAFVEFQSADAASKAATVPVSMNGQPVTLAPSRSREESQRYKVYIGDLSFNTKEQDLQSTLENQFGAVEFLRIISYNGASRGHAFVTFKSIEAADAARAAGNFTLDDRVVRIEKVRDLDRSRRTEGRGFGSDREGGYSSSRGGFGDRDGGYRGGNREGGYRGGDRDGGYRGGNRDGGYRGGDRDGGYSGGRGRDSYSNKESDSDSGYSGRGGRSGGSDSFY